MGCVLYNYNIFLQVCRWWVSVELFMVQRPPLENLMKAVETLPRKIPRHKQFCFDSKTFSDTCSPSVHPREWILILNFRSYSGDNCAEPMPLLACRPLLGSFSPLTGEMAHIVFTAFPTSSSGLLLPVAGSECSSHFRGQHIGVSAFFLSVG